MKKHIISFAVLGLSLLFAGSAMAQTSYNQTTAQNLDGGTINGKLKIGSDDPDIVSTTYPGVDSLIHGKSFLHSFVSYVKSYFNDKLYIGYDSSSTPLAISDAPLQLANSAKLLALSDVSATNLRNLCVNNDGVLETCIGGDTFVCGNAALDARNGASYQTVELDGQCWFKRDLSFHHFSATIFEDQMETDDYADYADYSNTIGTSSTFDLLKAFCASKDAVYDTNQVSVEVERDISTHGFGVLKVTCDYSTYNNVYYALERGLSPVDKLYWQSSPQHISPANYCPAGWRLPTLAEYTALDTNELDQLNPTSVVHLENATTGTGGSLGGAAFGYSLMTSSGFVDISATGIFGGGSPDFISASASTDPVAAAVRCVKS